ncbi:hypothetical protein ACFLS8_04080 [Chloroflexota bacterium]
MIASVMVCLVLGMPGCDNENFPPSLPEVPRTESWGIYALDLTTETVELLHSSASKLEFLTLNNAGDTLAFSQQFAGNANENEEICAFKIDGGVFRRITDNNLFDIYPVWSPDSTRLAFLSWRDKDLDIYVMGKDGSNQRKLYDSGGHDADIDWAGSSIAFTSGSQIWIMQDDGTTPVRITDPPNAGVWGNANLPFGDYDPRLSPDGRQIAFERLEDDTSPHGNYNIFLVNADGSGETRLTDNGYSQGIVSWSHSGTRLVFVVAGIGSEGKYDMYIMNSDGSDITNINPDYFPPDFLCHTPVFSADDSKVFFIGQWWE